MFPGEYAQPLVRKQFVFCPMISGFTTARLYAEDVVPPTLSGTGTVAVNALVTFENVGNTAFSVLLQQTSDRSTSGTRIPVSTAVVVVPGGAVQEQVNILQPFLEVWCNGSGPGQLRMQLESQRQWRELGFDKVADATFYPTSLWQAKEFPGPVSSP